MCRIESTVVSLTLNRISFITDTEKEIVIHGDDIGIDFLSKTPDQAMNSGLRYLHRIKEQREARKAESGFKEILRKAMQNAN